jgi:hypothetical protein
MAGIERLIQTDQLKTTHLLRQAEAGQLHQFFHYDDVFDAVMILIVPPETETVVHYIDDQVALLYLPDTLEIVGLQIEDFEHSFLPRHDRVRRVWRLGDALDVRLENVGDIVIAAERKSREVTREIIQASEIAAGQPGEKFKELVAALTA